MQRWRGEDTVYDNNNDRGELNTVKKPAGAEREDV